MQRKTQQRETIQAVLTEAARPLTVHEILERAAQEVPGIGIATVYRCVKALMEANKVELVEIVGEPLRYETVKSAHHHHFVCEKCKKVFDVEGCASIASMVPYGFKLRDHEIVLYGVCAACG